MSKHRGRIQVQGDDMNPELSRPWSQETPREVTKGIADLESLKDECTEAQYSHRDKAFDDACRFVQNAHPQGVGPPVCQTFKNRNLPRKHKTARVDIEVKAGIAFV